MGAFFTAFGLDWRLLIIQGVNFAVLIAVLTYFLYRPILKMIDDRRAKIAEGVRAADAAAQRLADAQQEGEGIVGEATREAEGLVATARNSAGELHTQLLKDSQTQADVLLADARAHAEETKRRALAESDRDIAKAAMLAAEKILREKKA